MQAKKVLLTGGAGFIGSQVAAELIRNKYEVVILDDFSTGDRANIPENVKTIAGSINDPQCLREAFAEPPDSIIHLAAVVSIRNSFANFYDDGHVNINGTLNLLNHAVNAGVRRFIFASSMAVYGPTAKPAANLAETDFCNPVSPYGVAKLTIEKYLALLSGFYNMNCICLRYFNTYGNQRGYSPYVGVINIMIKKLLKGERLEIFGDGSQERDFIHVYDVARATVKALDSEGPFSVCNVGSGKGTKILDLARLICDKMGKPFDPVFAAAAPGEIHRCVADVGLALQNFDFRADLSLDSMIADVIAWNLQNFAGEAAR